MRPAGDAAAAELIGSVRALELAARRNAAGLNAGDYRTAIPGRGLIFHESRKYVPGEPARLIDWSTTARLGEPYVKVHLEERQRDVFVALDVSPSMHAGFQEKTKLEYAVELAATLAVSAVDGGDRVGWVLFADRLLGKGRPRGGGRQLFALLRALLDGVGPWTRRVSESDPRTAIHAIQRYRGNRFVVFLISDFIDHDLPEDLKYVRARHDVSLLHVYDPVEYASSREVTFPGLSPEPAAPQLAARRARLHLGDGGELAEMTAFLRDAGGRYRIATASFSTREPVTAALGRFFHAKRRLARR